MTKFCLFSFLIFFSNVIQAQTPSVEKSIFGMQVGFLGIWANNERKLANTITLRSEIGFDGAIWCGSFYDQTGYGFTPVFRAEPRFYYNLGRRINKKRSITKNSGNFISLPITFHPAWFEISNYSSGSIVSDISVIPTWGIRRHIGKHFTYEAGLGLGYGYVFAKNAGYSENVSELAANVHLRVGYTI